MMENDGEAGDDEGSGWFEVKKKHRASAKLSTQKVSGGPSNKVHSYSPCHLASTDDEAGNTQSRRQLRALKVGLDFAARSKVSTECWSPASVEGDRGTGCLVELGVNRECELPGVLLCTPMKDANSESGTETTREVPSIGNSDGALRIKWGILEDVPLALHECCGDSGSSAKVNYGDVANGNIEDHGDSVKVIATSEDEGQFPDVMISSAVQEESLEGTRTEVNEIPSKDLDVGKFDSNDAVLNLKEKHDGDARTTPVEVNGTLLLGPRDRSPNEALSISEVSATNENAGMLDTILPQDQRRGAGISGGASVTSSLEDRRRMLDASTDGAEIGEGELEESKERFRERLWCFLFENLNRAVDELYLLCELECDMGQMNEAIVVLEEARSDFRELKCRVEHFETTKRASSQSSKDGTPVNVKTDHRRPHALSWEVRRMTTSPHRAEILSSSLEAFKKIQQERASKHVTHNAKDLDFSHSTPQHTRISRGSVDVPTNSKEPGNKSEKATAILETDQGNPKAEKQNVETTRPSKARLVQIGRSTPQSLSASTTAKCKKESVESTSEIEKPVHKKDKVSAESRVEKNPKAMDMVKRHSSLLDKEKEKERERRTTAPWKSMDAWKEKRNWEDILKSPLRCSSRVSHSPGVNRKGTDRARVLHDKLMSPEKKKKSALDMKREAEEKHARATRIRSQLENERVQRLHRTSEKLNRVNEWQAVRSLKLREGMYARHQLSESRHEAYLAQVARRAGDESSKVNEVRFITSLNEENKKLILRQKLHDSEMRRAEKLQVIRTKQKDIAREEAVLERRKLLEAEKLQRLAETQRKKEEAQVRREEERKASSAAREAKAVEQLRRKEVRAKAQQEEAELLAQRLAERLSESEQRRKYYLEQIREKASMDFRDQSSPLLRRSVNKEGQSRLIVTNSADDYQTSCISSAGDSAVGLVNATQQHPLKRRIKKIRQRLMALKYEPTEPPLGTENAGTGCKAIVGAARVKIGRWLQDLQRLRQARKEGAASIGLIVSDMVKFLEGKDPELHASRHAGLLDFISSALPASHTSKPEACQVTVYLLRLLRVVLSVPVNRSYFLAQNLLPPIIPMLSASLENYIKIVASSNPGSTNLLPNKTSTENLESIAEALDGFLWTVTTIMGHVHFDERQLHMQDGLMELIVAYQVIHRLRDLFALYDRPQVEGSPFPSSILISLNLLAVLTSRHGTVSSIDWESGIPKSELSNGFQEPKDVVSLGMGDSLVENISGDCTSHPIVHAIEDLAANESGQIFGEEKLPSSKVCLPEIPEGQPLDGERRKESSGISIGLDNGEAALQMHARSPSAESRSFALEEHAKSLLNHRDERNSMGGGAERKTVNERAILEDNESRKESNLKQPIVYLLSTINKTGLVSLPSLLTGVLLQANNRLSSEQAFYILPSNFEEVATGVLKVLNNLAILDITLLQSMLARSDLKMEFFHLMSFLLSHCSSKWKATNDQVGLLLLECLLLLGYFALFHTGNQAVLRWGKTPTILHKVCDLPFVFFSDPELTPILAGTLVAACYGSEQNKGVVEQELSTDMLLSLLKSCRQGLFSTQSDLDALTVIDPCDANQTVTEVRKPQSDVSGRSNRKSARVSLGRGGVTISSSIKTSKIKVQKDSRGTRTCDEWAVKHSLPASQASSTFMLHRRFPTTFLDRAEEFFSSLPV